MWLRMDGKDADISNTEQLVADPNFTIVMGVAVIPTNGCNNAGLCELTPRASMIPIAMGCSCGHRPSTNKIATERAEPELTDTRTKARQKADRLAAPCGKPSLRLP
jgi:hypothetical protein